MNQDFFTYDYKLVPSYFLRCLCYMKSRHVKRISKSDFYLNKGWRKLKQDMDVGEIIRMVHNVKIMNSILFTGFQ